MRRGYVSYTKLASPKEVLSKPCIEVPLPYGMLKLNGADFRKLWIGRYGDACMMRTNSAKCKEFCLPIRMVKPLYFSSSFQWTADILDKDLRWAKFMTNSFLLCQCSIILKANGNPRLNVSPIVNAISFQNIIIFTEFKLKEVPDQFV
jgi:hypothetical protein